MHCLSTPEAGLGKKGGGIARLAGTLLAGKCTVKKGFLNGHTVKKSSVYGRGGIPPARGGGAPPQSKALATMTTLGGALWLLRSRAPLSCKVPHIQPRKKPRNTINGSAFKGMNHRSITGGLYASCPLEMKVCCHLYPKEFFLVPFWGKKCLVNL